MKIRKLPRDKTGRALYEGDIIQFFENGTSYNAVIYHINEYKYGEFPDLVCRIIYDTDWRGNTANMRRETLTYEKYKTTLWVNPDNLRDDVPKHVLAKSERKIVLDARKGQ